MHSLCCVVIGWSWRGGNLAVSQLGVSHLVLSCISQNLEVFDANPLRQSWNLPVWAAKPLEKHNMHPQIMVWHANILSLNWIPSTSYNWVWIHCCNSPQARLSNAEERATNAVAAGPFCLHHQRVEFLMMVNMRGFGQGRKSKIKMWGSNNDIICKNDAFF